jgi:hypothetical protein
MTSTDSRLAAIDHNTQAFKGIHTRQKKLDPKVLYAWDFSIIMFGSRRAIVRLKVFMASSALSLIVIFVRISSEFV